MLISEQEKTNNGFKYTAFTNDKGNALNDEFLNKLQEYIEAINNAGLTKEQIMGLIANNSASKDYVNNYQQPWNLDKNVGRININNCSGSGCSANTKYGENHTVSGGFSIPMINSGTVRVNFSCKGAISGGSSDPTRWIKNGKIDVCVNDNIIKTLVYGTDFTYDVSNDKFSISTNVQRGDKIKFKHYLEVKESSNGSNGSTVSIVASDVSLSANIDTPYKYIDIPISTL